MDYASYKGRPVRMSDAKAWIWGHSRGWEPFFEVDRVRLFSGVSQIRTQPSSSTAKFYDLADLVRIIGTRWPVSAVAQLELNERRLSLLADHLDAAVWRVACASAKEEAG